MSGYTEVYKQVMKTEGESLLALSECIDTEVMDKIVEMLCQMRKEGGKVIIAGCGTSGAAAKKIAHTLNVVEIPALFCSPADATHGGLGVVQHRDTVILISKGGNTQELVPYIDVCSAKGAKTIAVTENEGSILAKRCDIFLKINAHKEADEWGYVATSSTLSVISAFDAIAIACIAPNGFTQEKFLLIHPSGAVGEKLAEKKRDIGCLSQNHYDSNDKRY